jgi:hypothetical protein
MGDILTFHQREGTGCAILLVADRVAIWTTTGMSGFPIPILTDELRISIGMFNTPMDVILTCGLQAKSTTGKIIFRGRTE